MERAILISLGLHVLFFALVVSIPERGNSRDPRKGLLAALLGPERQEEIPIPIRFHQAPGPSGENPNRSPLSDLNRRASGGDPSRPRGESPYAPERSGIEGLAPGRPIFGNPGRGGIAGLREPSEREKATLAFPKPPPPGGASRSQSAELAGLDRAIREAAQRSLESGEQGAGNPNPEGAYVDSGPLSFDTTWYDWGPYAEEMVRRIKLHWEIPELARLGWKGKLTIRFFILADGRVEGARIVRSSSIPPFDFAALQAIRRSSPFRPLPTELGSHREGVTVTFFYNIRPERSEEREEAR